MSGNQDFVIEDGVLTKYNGSGGAVVIPEGVTEIGRQAFQDCTGLTQVTFPNGLTEIGWSAFEGCTGLTQAAFPDGLTKIEDNAFQNCTALTQAAFPDGLTKIGYDAFRNCTSLTQAAFPDSLTAILGGAFEGCTGLTQVSFPDGLTYIWERAFSGCVSLVQVTLPARLIILSDCAFQNCTGLTQINLPEKLTNIGNCAFENCTGLTQVSGAGGLTAIGKGAFSGCAGLTALRIPEGVTALDGETLAGCGNLTALQVDPENPVLYAEGGALYCRDGENGLTLVSWSAACGAAAVPEGVERIGAYAFSGCAGLTAVALPESLKSVEEHAFENCSSLTEIVFPPKVTEMKPLSFKGCTALKQVTLSPDTQRIAWFYWDGSVPRFTVEPKFLRTAQKLSLEMTELTEFSDGEDLAYVVVYQAAKTWQDAVERQIRRRPELAGDVVPAMTALLAAEKRPKKAAWTQSAAFVLEWQKQVKEEDLRAFCAVAREKKCPVLAGLESDVRLRQYLVPEDGQAVRPPENPVERLVWEQWQVTPAVKELQTLVERGIPYADSEELCSKEALIWLIAFQLDNGGYDGYTAENLKAIQKNLDPIAAGLDRGALMDFLHKQVFSKDNAGPFIPAYCRYGDEDQIQELLEQMKLWHVFSSWGARGRDWENRAGHCLYYSDTKTAIRWLCYRGDTCLFLYAKMRGMSEQTLRDTILANPGLDQEGKKYYDLGGKTAAACMREDLTFTLWDQETGKAVRVMPKKGTDPEKYEKAKKDFVRLKKDIKTIVKERTNLLFQRFLNGEEESAENWKLVYFQNPLLRQLARLLVWSQGQKTFTMTPQGTADSAGQPYAVGEEPVKVAHPMEMEREDLARWQKYFTSHGLKQLFEQVWEPVEDFGAIRADRYQGMTLRANRLRSQSKHGIEFYFYGELYELYAGFADLELECDLTEPPDNWRGEDIDVVFGELRVKKTSRAANHVLARLDRLLATERVKKDDVTVADVLDRFTLAQVTELLNLAIENNCVNCTAALLEYKNKEFPDFDPMEIFTLE